MGNLVSACTSIAPPSMRSSRATRVIFPNGEIRQFREPINAAELMMECPGFFLAAAGSLHMGRRFSPLAADSLLERGNVYIMFQMKRVSSAVTAADMALMFMASSSAAKRITGRVSPDSSGEAPRNDQILRIDDGGEGFSAAEEFRRRLTVCRSKKPQLETINEEPLPLRSRYIIA